MLRSACAFFSAFLCVVAVPVHASPHSWSEASTIARNVVVGVALGIPAVQGDWNGTLQAGGSVGAAFLVTQGLKEAFPELRPDGSDRKSFPSAHAASAFAAAASLQNRYGWQVGIPAQLVATFVGIARVKGDKHHWYDVVAAAAIGEASGFLITSRRSETVRVMPWADSKGGGVALAMRF
jgi:membrane-associated phospholipid phosphatase